MVGNKKGGKMQKQTVGSFGYREGDFISFGNRRGAFGLTGMMGRILVA